MKQDIQNDRKLANASADLMVVFVIINNAGMMINVGVNVKN